MNPILIVDDEAAIAMLARRILTEAGYRCQAVTDSRAAANLLEKNRYDLVLLDVMMPHLDGYDLLAYLRPTGTPCIFITAKDAVAERVRGLNSGADDYIVKPFAPTELVARVESVLRRAGRRRGVRGKGNVLLPDLHFNGGLFGRIGRLLLIHVHEQPATLAQAIVDGEELGHEDGRAGLLDEQIVIAHVVLADERLDPAKQQPFVEAVVVPVHLGKQRHRHDVRALSEHEAVGPHLHRIPRRARQGERRRQQRRIDFEAERRGKALEQIFPKLGRQFRGRKDGNGIGPVLVDDAVGLEYRSQPFRHRVELIFGRDVHLFARTPGGKADAQAETGCEKKTQG